MSFSAPVPPFTRRWLMSSYDRDEVDAFFAAIPSKTADDIRTVRFKVRFFGGYDQQEVDNALDAWERSK